MENCVVLVTGGNGFLGQHIVKHLQLYTKNLKEIRVLDIVPYQKKLKYKCTVPVSSFTGSILDKYLVNKACEGIHSVIHVASLIDASMFPNRTAMHEINIKGTEILLEACKANNVANFIYCSSISIYYGFDEVVGGTESTVSVPDKLMFQTYALTKYIAHRKVLSANGDIMKNGRELRTCAVLPVTMYGELDQAFVYQYLKSSERMLIPMLPKLGKMEAKVQISYVGNVAMMFVNAFETLRKGNDIGGEHFFASDDTPADSIASFLRPYLKDIGCDISSTWYIPVWVFTIALLLLYFVLALIRPFRKVNTKYNIIGFHFFNQTFYVTYDKAKNLLGYRPLYDFEAATKHSRGYYLAPV